MLIGLWTANKKYATKSGENRKIGETNNMYAFLIERNKVDLYIYK